MAEDDPPDVVDEAPPEVPDQLPVLPEPALPVLPEPPLPVVAPPLVASFQVYALKSADEEPLASVVVPEPSSFMELLFRPVYVSPESWVYPESSPHRGLEASSPANSSC